MQEVLVADEKKGGGEDFSADGPEEPRGQDSLPVPEKLLGGVPSKAEKGVLLEAGGQGVGLDGGVMILCCYSSIAGLKANSNNNDAE